MASTTVTEDDINGGSVNSIQTSTNLTDTSTVVELETPPSQLASPRRRNRRPSALTAQTTRRCPQTSASLTITPATSVTPQSTLSMIASQEGQDSSSDSALISKSSRRRKRLPSVITVSQTGTNTQPNPQPKVKSSTDNDNDNGNVNDNDSHNDPPIPKDKQPQSNVNEESSSPIKRQKLSHIDTHAAPTITQSIPQHERYVELPANGDCFYVGIVMGFAKLISELDVESLRNIVADRLDQTHFEALQVAFQASPRDYSYMRRCKTIDDLKARQRVCGSVAGSRMCVWADWTQIQLVADALHVILLVRDAAANYTMMIRPTGSSIAEFPGLAGTKHFIHLVRTNSCHYNVFAMSDHDHDHAQVVLTLDDVLNSSLAKMFAKELQTAI